MRRTLVKLLVLVIGVTFTLPPGWCCMAAQACAATPVRQPEHQSCCAHKTPKKNTDKTPCKPSPCAPCADRLTLDGKNSGRSFDSFSLPALAILTFDAPLPASTPPAAHPSPIVLACSPHVLHCVWLC